jgi:hypothetical protein
MSEHIPFEYQGWWRIVETSQWDDDLAATAKLLESGRTIPVAMPRKPRGKK